MFAAASEGGVRHDSDEKCGKAAFLYLPQSAVVSRFETALPLWTREKSGDVSDPPQNRGVMRPFVAVACGIPLLGPMGSLTSSFIPAGRLGKTPFPLALHRVGSVLAVKGSLRRFAPWTAPGRSERRAAYEGKGGIGPWGARAS